MFEEPVAKPEKDRSILVMVGSAVAVLVVALVVIVVVQRSSGPKKLEIIKAGAVEFDSYSPSLKLIVSDRRVGERLNGRYARILGKLQNEGDRILSGLQLRAAANGPNGQVLKERIITLIPNERDSLEPGQTMQLDLYLDPIPLEIQDIILELHGLKLQDRE